MAFSRPLAELRAADEPRFGGKSASLGELMTAGIPVPGGFALSVAAFETFVSESGLAERATTALTRLSPGDLDAIGAASHAISEAMRFAPVPESVRRELAERYTELGDDLPVAVRSSAVGEDSQDATFAGQQETYLWVRGVDHVCDAVRDCWVSLYSTPALSYRLRLGEAAAAPAMGVTIQVMVDAAISGVMFTCNPVSGDPSMVAINASWGLGLAVVGGEVTPDDLLVSKVTREVVREQIQAKEVEYVPDAGGRGAVRVAVPAERRDARCLDGESVARLVDVARQVEGYFGCHQDIEWAFDRQGTLAIVQSRPVTAVPQRPAAAAPADALSLVMQTFGVKPPDVP